MIGTLILAALLGLALLVLLEFVVALWNDERD